MSESSHPASAVRLPVFLAYGLMLSAAAGIYLLIRSYGETLTAPGPAVSALPGTIVHVRVDTLLHVLLALVVVIVMARGLGMLFRLVQQPAVVGEIIAGIMLGPSVLGRLAPGVSAYVLPPSVTPFLGVISEV